MNAAGFRARSASLRQTLTSRSTAEDAKARFTKRQEEAAFLTPKKYRTFRRFHGY